METTIQKQRKANTDWTDEKIAYLKQFGIKATVEKFGITRKAAYSKLFYLVRDEHFSPAFQSSTRTSTVKNHCKRCNRPLKTNKQMFCPICEDYGEIKTAIKNIPEKCITLGADPEFLFVKPDGYIESAYRVFGTSSTYSKVGCDGNSNVAELRPTADYDALRLVKKINKLLAKAKLASKGRNLQMVAGHGKGNYPVGGHIHFGYQRPMAVINALDLLSMLLIKIEDKVQAKKRHARRYGRLGAYEGKSWGFEYRTPPSWLSDPEYAAGILALYHSVVIESVVAPEDFQKWNTLYNKIKNSHSLERIWTNCQIKNLKQYYPEIIALITGLNTVRANYHNYREPILNLVEKCMKRIVMDAKINEKKWNITNVTAEILKHFAIKINREDTYMELLNFQNKKTTGTSIYVYGLIQERPYEVMFNGLPEQISRILIDKCTELGFTYGTSSNLPIGIGFRLDARREKSEKLSSICQSIVNVMEGN